MKQNKVNTKIPTVHAEVFSEKIRVPQQPKTPNFHEWLKKSLKSELDLKKFRGRIMYNKLVSTVHLFRKMSLFHHK